MIKSDLATIMYWLAEHTTHQPEHKLQILSLGPLIMEVAYLTNSDTTSYSQNVVCGRLKKLPNVPYQESYLEMFRQTMGRVAVNWGFEDVP